MGARWRTLAPTLPSRTGGRRRSLPTAHIRRLRILTPGGRKGESDREHGRNQPHKAATAGHSPNHEHPDDRHSHDYTEADMAHMRSFYSEGEVVELMAAIGLFNYFNRFNNMLQMEPTQPATADELAEAGIESVPA